MFWLEHIVVNSYIVDIEKGLLDIIQFVGGSWDQEIDVTVGVQLKKPIPVFNADGTENCDGTIFSYVLADVAMLGKAWKLTTFIGLHSLQRLFQVSDSLVFCSEL